MFTKNVEKWQKEGWRVAKDRMAQATYRFFILLDRG